MCTYSVLLVTDKFDEVIDGSSDRLIDWLESEPDPNTILCIVSCPLW